MDILRARICAVERIAAADDTLSHQALARWDGSSHLAETAMPRTQGARRTVSCQEVPATRARSAGALTDPMITSASFCNGNGGQEVDLTNAARTVIARDEAHYAWQDGRCEIPFSFANVPSLAGYGLRLPGGNGHTIWLTPAQISNPIVRSITFFT
jgi:hypothetical protein